MQKTTKTTAQFKNSTGPVLKLHLLGPPKMTLNNRSLSDVGSRKAQALLFYLVVIGKPVARDMLVALLWPEMAEKSAKNNLRTTLASLKRQIGPYIDATSTDVAFNRHLPYLLDVETLRARLDAALSVQNLAELQAATDLYQGEFLQGFHVRNAEPFEDWLLQEREQLHLLTLRALETLVASSIAQHEYTIGLSAGRRLLAMEPWAEASHRQLMILLAASGQRVQALQQYEICCQALADELAIEPSAETVTLYQQIQAGTYNGAVAHRRPTLPVHRQPDPSPTNGTLNGRPLVPHNLATPLARFIGRQAALELIKQRLRAPACRLLTIVGPGGMGKTALALEVGQHLLQSHSADFADGIFFVSLSGIDIADGDMASRSGTGRNTSDPVASSTAVVTAIADGIGCKLQPELPSQIQLQNYLRTRHLLLILDNFEHLLAQTDVVVKLLTNAPHVKVIITSRIRLNVRGETVLTLDKLSLPSASYLPITKAAPSNPLPIIDDFSGGLYVQQESEAVAMFVQRAQCLDLHFTLSAENIGPVMQICQLVDGLPLGIELATSMLTMVGCAELAKELADSLSFLAVNTRDLRADQRTLYAVFKRSWRLLSPQEQMLLAKLAIFPGSFTRSAAKSIVGATIPLLMRLLNQSLLSRAGEDRYAMHRSIREFALKKLAQWPTQIKTSHIQYARYYLDFLAQNEHGLMGGEQALIAQKIAADIDNVRAAWRWGLTYNMITELNLGLRTLFLFHQQQGLFADAFDLFGHALRHFSSCPRAQSTVANDQTNLLIGRLHTYFGWSNASLGRISEADAVFRAGLSILQQADDLNATVGCLTVWGSALAGRDLKQSEAILLQALDLAHTAKENTVKKNTVNDNARVVIYIFFAATRCLQGDYADAERSATDGYILAKQLNWSWGLANSQRILGLARMYLGNYPAAEANFRDCMALARAENQKVLLVEATLSLGDTLRLQGRLDEAQGCYVEGRQLAEQAQFNVTLAQVHWAQGCLAEQRGAYAAAQAFFTESLATNRLSYTRIILPTLGWALIGLGELDEAERYFRDVLAAAEAKHSTPISLDAQAGLVYVRRSGTSNTIQEHQDMLEEDARVLQNIYHHPAATQETRARVAKIAAALGISVLEDIPLVAIAQCA